MHKEQIRRERFMRQRRFARLTKWAALVGLIGVVVWSVVAIRTHG